ncbi:hypothetical protein RND71_021177 [Anisodus tanguticus]|uniref:Transposase-associated domain-containing protein n=1 Tax=Anisodus tanguticus TaxID=243964 RepID=A0AAE1RW28_9SOLA|nr:hypothetical protein RND71_021177 [Anisodus tanguticus]
MAPNKQWMELINDRLDNAYIDGVENFLDYAFTRLGDPQLIRCPCIKCGNATSSTRAVVRSHLIVHGIIPSYTLWYHHGERSVPCKSGKGKKVRGLNICKKVLRLKPGEKLRVTFYQNRVVGKNHTSFTRHLGLLVRDRNMCPLRVHSWLDIEEHKLENMWKAVTEKFDSDDMNDQRDHVLQHMRKLWNNWRGLLHKKVKSKSLHGVLKDVPVGVDKSDWTWLVKEHFLSDTFKEASTRNSVNRSKVIMPHRTGSKPHREIIYELGGKDGNPPDMATIFFETRKKDNELVEPETIEKYAEIQELVQSEPSLTNIEVVERCFGPQCKSHVVGFGGGITAKELKGGTTSKAALLEELKAAKKEKESLQKRIERLERIVVRQPSSPPPDQELEA